MALGYSPPLAGIGKKEEKLRQDLFYEHVCAIAGQRLDRDAVEYLLKRGDAPLDIVAKLINLR